MKKLQRKVVLVVLLLTILSGVQAAPKGTDSGNKKNVFTVENPDYLLSPATGMTREHWIDAAQYLLAGAFSYIQDVDDPMKFPKQPGKSYPDNEKRVPTEKLEGLVRTLFVAAPLLKEDSSLVLNHVKVADYYRHQILQLMNPESPSFIVPRAPNGGPSQNLVEFGALAISLFIIPDVIWEPLPQDKKDALASVMLSYGDGPTVPSNWKFFNIFVLSFFKDQGYAVNENLLKEYLVKSLEDYRGEGWYNDAPAYDYYSMWAFQLYGAVWSEVFGKANYPEYVKGFEENFTDMQYNYPYMFSEEGKMMMYGRSISYRFGSISPFPFMGVFGDQHVNLGWMRRIASSTILQFLQHPEFLKDSVPTLGFYGPFEPAVQNYSCRGSAFWMGKAFLGLLVPEDNPFWTSTENNGPWETEFMDDKVYHKYSTATHTLLTDYPETGASEIRAWCHEKVKDDWQKFRSTENYNRLSYSSIFPWQADGRNGEVAMNYVFKNANNTWEALRLYTFRKFENGAYYRDAVLETNESINIQLADIPLKNGILRVDRNMSTQAIEMRLGHYALPKLQGEILTEKKKIGNFEATLMDNGVYQLAMIPVLGWENTEVKYAKGLHPEAEESAVVNVTARFDPNKEESDLYITLMLWKKSGQRWSKKELFPIKKIQSNTIENKVEIDLKNGDKKTILF